MNIILLAFLRKKSEPKKLGSTLKYQIKHLAFKRCKYYQLTWKLAKLEKCKKKEKKFNVLSSCYQFKSY